jgi:hypothetical protein
MTEIWSAQKAVHINVEPTCFLSTLAAEGVTATNINLVVVFADHLGLAHHETLNLQRYNGFSYQIRFTSL